MNVRRTLFGLLAIVAVALSIPAATSAASAPALSSQCSSSRWIQYLSWEGDTLDGLIMREQWVLDDLSYGDYDSMYSDSIDLQKFANSGIRWLDKHKPGSMWKSLWTYDRSSLSHTSLSAKYLAAYANGGSISYLTRSTAETKLATAATKKATAILNRLC